MSVQIHAQTLGTDYTKTVSNVSDANTALVVSKPSGAQVGDLLLAIVHSGQYATTGTLITAPGEPVWNSIYNNSGANGQAAMLVHAAWRIVAEDEPSQYTWGLAGNTGDDAAYIFRVTGVDPTNPIGSVGELISNSSSASDDCPSVTTQSANSLVLNVLAKANGSQLADPVPVPSGTDLVLAERTRSHSSGIITAIAKKLMPSVSASGVATWENITTSGRGTGATIELRALVTPTVPTLSGTLVNRAGVRVANATNLILSVDGVTVTSSLSTDAQGNWSFGSTELLTYGTTSWCNIKNADGTMSWAGNLSTQAEG